MYFAILGKNPEISKAELQLLQPTNITYPKKGVISFETEYPELLATLWGTIKSGKVVREKDLPTILQDVSIIGIKEIANGKHLKTTMGIRRFKTVDFFHTDKEIKEKGRELINLWRGDYGIVDHYQNIGLYETIDFEKPGRSMHMGMMPAKLTHIMINIWLSNIKYSTVNIQNLKVYDPFVGSGTTCFLANALGYDSIGSDKEMKYVTQNSSRRATTSYAHPDHTMQLFPHDITQALPQTILQEKQPLLIISEGRLWPIVNERTSPQEITRYQREVEAIYSAFLERLQQIHKAKIPVVAVITIPHYQTSNPLESYLAHIAQSRWLMLNSVSEVYKREGQKVGRKILIIQAKEK